MVEKINYGRKKKERRGNEIEKKGKTREGRREGEGIRRRRGKRKEKRERGEELGDRKE